MEIDINGMKISRTIPGMYICNSVMNEWFSLYNYITQILGNNIGR